MKIENGGQAAQSDLIASFEQEAKTYYDEHDKKEHLKISYDLEPEEIRNGLKRFQKEVRRKRKYIYISLCLFIVFINSSSSFL